MIDFRDHEWDRITADDLPFEEFSEANPDIPEDELWDAYVEWRDADR